MRLSRTFLSILFLTTLSLPAFAQSNPRPMTSEGNPRVPPVFPAIIGRWDATITPSAKGGRSYDVPFTLLIESKQNEVQASLVNGSDRVSFSRITWQRRTVTLHLDQYGGTVNLTCGDRECEHLNGEYVRLTRAGEIHYKVGARRSPIVPITEPFQWNITSLQGDWTFQFQVPETNPDRVAPGRFEQKPSHTIQGGGAEAQVQGTIAPVTGDYGVMAGLIQIPKDKPQIAKFSLSRFDGIHVLLLEGFTIASQATGGADKLQGTLTISPLQTLPFTATRRNPANAPAAGAAAEAEGSGEPDPEKITTVSDRAEPFKFSGVDLATGKTVTQANFSGKPVIIDIFGTWCPNCHDEAPVLADLYSRYHQQGLEIVSLAYEYTDDRARAKKLFGVFDKKYGIRFQTLFAGTTDEGQIDKTLPQLRNFGAFPTTIFVDRSGRVHAIYAGFSGPATGNYEAVKRRFEELVREILR